MDTIEKTGVFGTFEPTCKIRFLEEPNKDEEYIAVTPHYLTELLAAEMKLCALESGGVDNWSAYGWSMENYLEDCRSSYDMEKLSAYAFMLKDSDETIEECIENMDIENFAAFEVWSM